MFSTLFRAKSKACYMKMVSRVEREWVTCRRWKHAVCFDQGLLVKREFLENVGPQIMIAAFLKEDVRHRLKEIEEKTNASINLCVEDATICCYGSLQEVRRARQLLKDYLEPVICEYRARVLHVDKCGCKFGSGLQVDEVSFRYDGGATLLTSWDQVERGQVCFFGMRGDDEAQIRRVIELCCKTKFKLPSDQLIYEVSSNGRADNATFFVTLFSAAIAKHIAESLQYPITGYGFSSRSAVKMSSNVTLYVGDCDLFPSVHRYFRQWGAPLTGPDRG